MTETLVSLQARNLASTVCECIAQQTDLTVSDLREFDMALCEATARNDLQGKALNAVWSALRIVYAAIDARA